MNDELQQIWQADGGDLEMFLKLVQRDRAIRESVWRNNAVNIGIALFLVPILAACAWTGKTRLIQAGCALTALSFAVLAAAIFEYGRQSGAGPERELSAKDYARQFLAFCDGRARFLKSARCWFGVPFLAGMSLLIAGIRMYTGNMLLGLGLLLVLVVNAGGILHMARAISLTREKRRELEGLLSQMD